MARCANGGFTSRHMDTPALLPIIQVMILAVKEQMSIIFAATPMANQTFGATRWILGSAGTSASQNGTCVTSRTEGATEAITEAASPQRVAGSSASSGRVNHRTSTPELHPVTQVMVLASTTSVATLMASRAFGATPRTITCAGISATTLH